MEMGNVSKRQQPDQTTNASSTQRDNPAHGGVLQLAPSVIMDVILSKQLFLIDGIFDILVWQGSSGFDIIFMVY